MKVRKPGLLALALSLLVPAVCGAQQTNWLVAPYLWASDVGWDISSRGNGTVAFSDLVDKIDGAGLIRVEYTSGQFGLTFDYVGMSLSDGQRITTPGQVPVDIDIRAGLDMTVFEAGGFYRPSATDSGIDILAGLRYVNVDADLVVTPGDTQPQRFDSGKNFTDIYAGARYLHRLTEAWDFSIRADYGLGGSDGALNVVASVGWRSRGTFGMALAYRHQTFDVDGRVGGEPATNEFDFTGPALGFLFRF